MPDLYAISNAIAARFAAGQVTPPAGYTNIRSARADPPNAMGPLPAVYVFADAGDYEPMGRGGANERTGVHNFIVRFYFNTVGDIRRDSVALQKWASVLADQLRLSTQLGGTVAHATVTNYKIGVMTYGGKDYSGVELNVGVVTTEGWAAVA